MFDWLFLDKDLHPCLPWALTAFAVAYAVYVARKLRQPATGTINPGVQKDNAKVVDSFEIEDLGNQTVYCRCWRSAKVGTFSFDCLLHLTFYLFSLIQFPYCDGTHEKHNKATGDNVGPLIVKRRS